MHQQSILLGGIYLRDRLCRCEVGRIQIIEYLRVNFLVGPRYGNHLVNPHLGEIQI